MGARVTTPDELVEIKGFLFELLDPDVYGNLCAPEVRDEARRLLRLPHPASVNLPAHGAGAGGEHALGN